MDTRKFQQAVDELLAAIAEPVDSLKAVKKTMTKRSKSEQKLILQSYGRGPNCLIRQSPLQFAVYIKNVAVIKYLLQKYKADINQSTNGEEFSLAYRPLTQTALGYAVLNNNTSLARALITEYAANVYSNPDDAPNLIHIACDNGNFQLAKLFIDRGVKNYIGVRSKSNVDSFSKERTKTMISFGGSTKLYEDSVNKIEESIRSLDISTTNKETSLLQNKNKNNNDIPNDIDIINKLPSKKPMVEGIVERPGFMVSVEKGFLHIAKYFLQKKVPINAGDRYRNTALHIAARNGEIETVQFLLDNGAQFIRNKFDMTPLHIACIYMHEDLVEFFLEYLENKEDFTQEMKAETYELLGASLGIYAGYRYLTEAWKVRHSLAYIVQQKVILAPQKCYDMQTEHESLAQLGEIYREQVHCLMKHPQCNMYNNRQEKESMIIKERILGVDNPYVALGLDRLKYHNKHSNRSDRYFMFLVKQLQILDQYYDDKSLVSLWVEVTLFLAELPKMSSNLHYVRQLEKIADLCAEVFIEQDVWVDYTLATWKQDFTGESKQLATVLDKVVTAFYYIIHLVPTADNKWLEAKKVLHRFIALSMKLLSEGKCTKCPLHSLFSIDVWNIFTPEVVMKNMTELVQLMIKYGLNPNMKDQNGNTPLHYAALHRKQWYTIFLIQLLKENKAHLDVINYDRKTPYQLYIGNTREEIPEKYKRSISRATNERSNSRASNVTTTQGNKSKLSNADRSKSKATVNSVKNETERNKSRLTNISQDAHSTIKSRATIETRVTKSRLSMFSDIQEENQAWDSDLAPIRDKEIAAAINPGVSSLLCMCATVVKVSKIKYKSKLSKKLRLQVLIH